MYEDTLIEKQKPWRQETLRIVNRIIKFETIDDESVIAGQPWTSIKSMVQDINLPRSEWFKNLS